MTERPTEAAKCARTASAPRWRAAAASVRAKGAVEEVRSLRRSTVGKLREITELSLTGPDVAQLCASEVEKMRQELETLAEELRKAAE